MFKNLITIMLAACCTAVAYAQIKPDSTKTHKPDGVNIGVGFEPIFGFNNCFKLDLEVHQLKHFYGFELNPEVYLGNHILSNNSDHISGWGLGLYQKFYLYDNGSNKHPVMFAYGATYRSVNVTYDGEGFIPYTQNGLNYYRYGNFTDVLKNNSLLTNFYVSGRLVDVPDAFFLDLYIGFGYKFANQQSGYTGYRSYYSNVFDYGYKGTAFLAGFKLGFEGTIKK